MLRRCFSSAVTGMLVSVFLTINLAGLRVFGEIKNKKLLEVYSKYLKLEDVYLLEVGHLTAAVAGLEWFGSKCVVF